MGAGGSSESKPSDAIFLNPAGAVLQNLFGTGVVADPEGGYRITSTPGSGKAGTGQSDIPVGEIPQGGYAPRVFGPESFANVGEFIQTPPFTAGAIPPLAQLATQGAALGLDTLNNFATPALRELLSTGSPVDVDPLVHQAVSDVAEQLAPITGLFSTDLANAATRTSAQLRVGAQEAARQRQVDVLPLSTLLATTQTNLPISAGLDLLGLGEQFTEYATPGGRQRQGLIDIAGIQPTSAVPRGNASSGKTTSVL